MCNRVTSTPHADHIKPHEGDVALFYDEVNIWTLCSQWHNSRKRLQENRGYSAACDENGRPTDPGHPWNRRR